MIRELDIVVLTEDMPEHGLKAGDVGTVVLVHGGGMGYEVEFMTLRGETVTVVSLHADQVRPVGEREIAHARPLQPLRL
ncbi:MAG: DUF4926 domain-containing protein [Fimbriimonadales bacterium]|nr:DUF4926 domain-containing protein [Fimbriimonadales bacterium]